MKPSKRRIITVSILGTALEFYDFTLYGVFAAIIAQVFFPSENAVASQLMAFGAFAAAFFTRPLGAIVFGHIGDKYGRKGALSFSILLMGIPTAVMGVLPGYNTLGILAPITIVLCRMLQGLCAGGEYNGAPVYALEHLGKNKPGFYGALIAASGGLGGIIGMFFGFWVTRPEMPTNAWRYPFILGFVISIIGYYLRRFLPETPEFLEKKKTTALKKLPIRDVFQKRPKAFMLVFSLGALDGALAYTLVGFMNVYMVRYAGMTLNDAMLINTIALALYLVMTPLAGALFDKTNPFSFFTYTSLIIGVGIFPVFTLMQQHDFTLALCASLLFSCFFSAISGAQHAFMQTLFPVTSRYSGIAVGFNLGSACLGGSAPIIMMSLIESTQNVIIPAGFIVFLISLFLWTLYQQKHQA